MVCSSCNKYLAIADCSSNIGIWKNENSKWIQYCRLPKYKCIPTTIGIQSKQLLLVVAYADQKVKSFKILFMFSSKNCFCFQIVEYDICKKMFTEFSNNLDKMQLDKRANKQFPIKNVTFDPRNPNIIILHDDSNIIRIDKEKVSCVHGYV